MVFLGVDGGSTKTELLLADEKGRLLARRVAGGCNYIQLGSREAFAAFFRCCIEDVCAGAGLSPQDVDSAMVGLPVYGEMEECEETMPATFDSILGKGRTWLANDTVPGWSGSLGARPGIHVVSGTGSIVYGMDEKGKDCRVGGWSLLFADEGSGSWMGVKVLNTFFRQADGRLPRTALYDIVRRHFGLTKDLFLISLVNSNIDTQMSRFAKLQFLAEEAYLAGDESMAALYVDAAGELANCAHAVRGNLDFDPGQPVRVSYYGGVFKAGKVILEPFAREIEARGMRLIKPKYPPGIGAVALAAKASLSTAELETMQAALARELAIN